LSTLYYKVGAHAPAGALEPLWLRRALPGRYWFFVFNQGYRK
jgi:hypothetical protein